MTLDRLLTQAEVARVLRRSVASVARLRRAGELSYLPGHPVLIPEAELTAYLERILVRREVKAKEAPRTRTPAEAAASMKARLQRSGQYDTVIRLAREAAARKAVKL